MSENTAQGLFVKTKTFYLEKYTDNRGRVKTGEYDLDLNEFLIVCCLTSISTIFKKQENSTHVDDRSEVIFV